MELEPRLVRQMCDIPPATGQKIVQPRHRMPIRQKPIAQMRPYESGGAGDDYAQVTPNGLF